jgi:hypothetical protein
MLVEVEALGKGSKLSYPCSAAPSYYASFAKECGEMQGCSSWSCELG